VSSAEPLRLRREDITSRVEGKLIAALNAELSSRYPEDGACHFRLDANEVAEGNGAFLVGYVNDEAVACGAVRRIDARTGEIKRMYVVPAHRGKRHGAVVLAALGREARRLGLSRLVLETGDRNPEAVTLYTRVGFARIPPFGEYVESPLSMCMGVDLLEDPLGWWAPRLAP
jgi:GNAT superfamily N-acetyltransferase